MYEKLLLQYYVNNRYPVVYRMSMRSSELWNSKKIWERVTGPFPKLLNGKMCELQFIELSESVECLNYIALNFQMSEFYLIELSGTHKC